MPLLPTAMECGIESTYPVNDESSTGFLMNFGNAPSIALTFSIGYLLDRDSHTCQFATPASITFLVLVGVMATCIMCYNGGYNRLHAESAKLLPAGAGGGGEKADDDF